jgi:hypothetical protein
MTAPGTPMPSGLRDIYCSDGLRRVNAALAAHASGEPPQGMPSNEAIRAACVSLRDGGAPCLCAFDPALPRVPCLTAIGLAAHTAGALL